MAGYPGPEQDVFATHRDPRWVLTADGWEPRREPGIEAVFALVNGYLGTRAAVEEGSDVSDPATFINGVFDTVTEEVAQAAATPEHQVIAAPTPELVVAPDWSRLRITVGGASLGVDSAEVLEQRRTLDMRRGVLVREWRVRTGTRTTRLRSLRFASLDDRHVLGQVLELTPEDWSGPVEVEAIVDGDVTNGGGVRHLIGHQTRLVDGGLLLTTATSEKHTLLCFATAATLRENEGGEVVSEDASTSTALVQRWSFDARRGRPCTLRKVVTVFTSRDDTDPAARAAERLKEAVGIGVPTLLESSARAWTGRWASSDVEITGDEETQRKARFAIYHLIGCATPDDEYASPGARSLTGERYKGHVFWDTEIFVLPFFVYTHPPTARALLMYRYHTLPAARERARAMGYRGALYAWESTDTGVDVTPPFVYNAAGERLEILTGLQEHHISADVAYGIWQYWRATQDEAFILDAGAEMLLEMARFWASRAERDEDGRYHVRKVIGPDEFHEHTHHPDRWRTLSVQSGLEEAELATWDEVAEGLVDNFDPETNIFEQHSGYFDLEDIDLRDFEPRTKSMDVLLGWSRLTRSQIIKQADVMMLLFLLGDEYPREVHEANFRYYEPRTTHDSSLSPSFHALAAARSGDLETAKRYFEKAANLDLDFSRGVTAAGGVHIAALGGMWHVLVFGFGGMFAEDAGPRFEPHVPEGWQTLRFSVLWRRSRLRITVTDNTPDVAIESAGREAVQPRTGPAQ
ncbi:MAG: glycoside hydrolase family 65 [Actinobacteria bacterium]|nr:glycoside hydrolase family 65 [Actinomycetota bacterium]